MDEHIDRSFELIRNTSLLATSSAKSFRLDYIVQIMIKAISPGPIWRCKSVPKSRKRQSCLKYSAAFLGNFSGVFEGFTPPAVSRIGMHNRDKRRTNLSKSRHVMTWRSRQLRALNLKALDHRAFDLQEP